MPAENASSLSSLAEAFGVDPRNMGPGTTPGAAIAAATAAAGEAAPGPGKLPAGQRAAVEKLDYEYVRKCTDARELESIVLTLRSGVEGLYPHLERYAEDRLREVDPDSRILTRAEVVRSLKHLAADERKNILEDLESWTTAVGAADREVAQTSAAAESAALPPVRGQRARIATDSASSRSASSRSAPSNASSNTAARISGQDFRAWERYNVEEALAEIDGEDDEKKSMNKDAAAAAGVSRTSINSADVKKLPPPYIARMPPSEAGRKMLATQEKDKGNEAFKAGDLDEALVYYSRSISAWSSAAAFNNRALVQLKRKNYAACEQDCNKVLDREPENIKALMRRGQAFQGRSMLAEARADYQRVKQLKPDHPSVDKRLAEVAEAASSSSKQQQLPSASAGAETSADAEQAPAQAAAQPSAAARRRRLVIEEVEDDDSEEDDEDEGEQSAETESGGSANSNNSAPATTAAANGGKRRMVIEEDSDSDGGDADGDGDETAAAPAPSVPSPTLTPPPPDVTAAKEAGKAAYVGGRYGEALAHYSGALDKLAAHVGGAAPSTSERELRAVLLNNRAMCSLKIGECRKCIADCSEAVAEAQTLDTQVKALLRRAAAHEHLERYAAAFVDSRKALTIMPTAAAAQASMTRLNQILRTSCTPVPPPEPLGFSPAPYKTLLDSSSSAAAPAASTQRAKPAAAPAASTPSSAAPATPTPTPTPTLTFDEAKSAGNALVKRKAFAAAAVQYGRCIELDPAQAAPWNNRALCHLRLEQWAEAERDAAAALEREPANVKALFRRAQARAGLGDPAGAVADLEACLRLDPQNQATQRELAVQREQLTKKSGGRKEKKSQEKKTDESEESVRAAAAAQVLTQGLASEARKVEEAKAAMEAKMAELEAARARLQAEQQTAAKHVAETERLAAIAREQVAKSKSELASKEAQVEQAASQVEQAAKKMTPLPQAPATSAEFLKAFRDLAKDPSGLALMLDAVPAGRLPKLFSNQLEADHLLATVTAVVEHLPPERAFAVVAQLPKAKRYAMVRQFLDDDAQAAIGKALQRLKTVAQARAGKPSQAPGFTVQAVEELAGAMA